MSPKHYPADQHCSGCAAVSRGRACPVGDKAVAGAKVLPTALQDLAECSSSIRWKGMRG